MMVVQTAQKMIFERIAPALVHVFCGITSSIGLKEKSCSASFYRVD